MKSLKNIFNLIVFETSLFFLNNLTRPILIYIGGSFLLVLINFFLFNSLSNALPWSILFISGVNIAYAPFMFSWETKNHINKISNYSISNIILAKWLFIVIYVIVSTGISVLIFISNWSLIKNIILSHSVFLIGTISFVDILYASKHIVFMDIDSKKGYRQHLNNKRWLICFLPLFFSVLYGIIGFFCEPLLDYYCFLLYFIGALSIFAIYFWIVLIKKYVKGGV